MEGHTNDMAPLRLETPLMKKGGMRERCFERLSAILWLAREDSTCLPCSPLGFHFLCLFVSRQYSVPRQCTPSTNGTCLLSWTRNAISKRKVYSDSMSNLLVGGS